MADADDVRRLALALPGVEEIPSDGFDFRVGGQGFIWSYPERRPGQRRAIRTSSASAIEVPPGSRGRRAHRSDTLGARTGPGTPGPVAGRSGR